MKFFLMSLLAAALVVCAQAVATASLTVNVVDPGDCPCACEEDCYCCEFEDGPPSTVTLNITNLGGGSGTGDPFSGEWQLELNDLVFASRCPGGAPACTIWGGLFTIIGEGPDSCQLRLQVECCGFTNPGNYYLTMFYAPTIGGFGCQPAQSAYLGDGFADEYTCDPLAVLFELTAATQTTKECAPCDIQNGWVGNYQILLSVP